MKSRLPLLLGIVLTMLTLFAYREVSRNGFINFDDPLYVQNNPLLVGGVSLDNAQKAFTTFHGGYWIPLTWLSFQVDYELFGLSPGGYHRTNLLLHLATVLLLFHLLRRLTNCVPASFFVAALFAVHPIQVESVAWVTERKDVLSTFFWMLTTLAYLRYVERRSVGRYLLVAVSLCLGLMAKPMLVTLPCTLLLLDYWPLRRMRGSNDLAEARFARCSFWFLAREKLPLLLLAIGAGVLAVITQDKGTAVKSLDDFSVLARIENALVSYVLYLGKIFWPTRLAVFYPHPGASRPLWHVALAAGTLACITLGCLSLARRRPYLIIGWLWFLGTLFPVSGVLQSGWQGMADRFAYVPALGIFIMIAWTLKDVLEAPQRRRTIAWSAVAASLLVCVVLTQRQVRRWNSAYTIWRHTIAVTPSNFMGHLGYASALLNEDRLDEAAVQVQRSIALKPDYHHSYHLLGSIRFRQGRITDASRAWEEAVRRDPSFVPPRARLAESYALLRQIDAAEQQATQALQLNDRSPIAHHGMAIVREKQQRYDEALRHCETALALNPHLPYRADLERIADLASKQR